MLQLLLLLLLLLLAPLPLGHMASCLTSRNKVGFDMDVPRMPIMWLSFCVE